MDFKLFSMHMERNRCKRTYGPITQEEEELVADLRRLGKQETSMKPGMYIRIDMFGITHKIRLVHYELGYCWVIYPNLEQALVRLSDFTELGYRFLESIKQ